MQNILIQYILQHKKKNPQINLMKKILNQEGVPEFFLDKEKESEENKK